jgi:hypothetical protein
MTVTRAPRLARRVLTGIAIAAVAATCMVSSGVTTSAAGTHRQDVSSATKEWKSMTLTVTAPSTKEW